MNILKMLFRSKKPALNKPVVSGSLHFEIGDKVKLSDKALENFNGSFKDFMGKMVYQVVDKDASVWQGVRLKLHCGTTLWADEAVKVDAETPLRT
jgi:hypothetical protein